MSVSSSDRLVEDLRRVIEDAETLLRETASLAGDSVGAARERLAESVRTARAADRYVRDNPWRSIGVAAGVGLILGVILSRR